MTLTSEQKIKLYTNLVRCRKADEFFVEGFAAGKVLAFWHSGQGQEAIGVGAVTFLREDDYIFFTHRGEGVNELIPRGLSMKKYIARIFGKEGSGPAFPELGMMGMAGTVGGLFTIGAGLAFTAKQNGKGQVVMQCLGDGDTGHGTFHTALLMSRYWNLPTVFLCSNNAMAMWVPTNMIYPRENLADLVYGYDIPSAVVDGQDVEAVNYASQAAVDRARAGGGPSFIECKTHRFRTHNEGMADFCHTSYRDQSEIENWKQNRDPIKLYQEKLKKEGVLTDTDIARINSEIALEVKEAEEYVAGLPVPSEVPDNLEKAIYVD